MKLRKGESVYKNGYRFRQSGKKTLYAPTIKELREKVKERELIENKSQVSQTNKPASTTSWKETTLYEECLYYLKTRQNLRRSTLRSYESWLNHLKDEYIFSMPLNKIKASDLKLFLSGLGEKGFSQSTINCYYTGLIKPAFQLAMDDEAISYNPAQFKLTNVVDKSSKKGRALTPVEEQTLRTYLNGTNNKQTRNNRDVMIFDLETGLRASELCGLMWDDIDFDNRKIHISRQLVAIPEGNYFEDLKSESGNRTIPMTDEAELCLRRASEYSVGELVFNRPCGSPITRHNLAQSFKCLARNFGLEGATMHSLRHTYCSNLARRGVPIKVAQYLMGHKNSSTTMDFYTHFEREDIEKAFWESLGE